MIDRRTSLGDWKGPIGLVLGGIIAVKLFFDFGNVEKFKKGMSDLKKEIDARLNKMKAEVPHISISRLTISGESEDSPSGSSTSTAAEVISVPLPTHAEQFTSEIAFSIRGKY